MNKTDEIKKIDFICKFFIQKTGSKIEIYQHPLFVAEKKHQPIHTMSKLKSKIPYYHQLILKNNKKSIDWLRENLIDIINKDEYNHIIMNRNYFLKNEKSINPDWIKSFKNLNDLTSLEMLDEMIEKILEYQENNNVYKFLPQYLNDLLNLVYKQNILFKNIEKELSYTENFVD